MSFNDTGSLKMKFDGNDFMNKMSSALNLLNKFDDSLNLKNTDKANKQIDSFCNTITKKLQEVTFAPIEMGLDKVTASFSIFEATVLGIFTRLGQKIADFGIDMVKHLSVDQVSRGFDKYEKILRSTQTILAADPNTNQEEVNEQLKKLVWYTDETSYAMEDMVSNISMFTNQGKNLNDAVNMMIGIGNAAGMAGSGVEQASHAMTGFTKAMGQGYMTAGIWNTWIKTSNIGTMEFKKRAIEAAKAVGTIKQAEDGNWYSIYDTQKVKTAVTAENFQASLTKGKWFNEKVMESVLKTYSKSIDDIYEKYQETGLSTSEILEKYGKEFDEFSTKAFLLGQEATTFTQAIESLFDALSSRWMQIMTLIFGDYEEARKLWTGLANWLYDTFVVPMDSIYEIMEEWADTVIRTEKDSETGVTKQITAHDGLIQSFKNVLEAITVVSEMAKKVFGDIFGSFSVKKLVKLTTRFEKFTERLILSGKTAEKFETIFANIAFTLKLVFDTIKRVSKEFKLLFGIVKDAISTKPVLDRIIDITNALTKLALKFYDLGKRVIPIIDKAILTFSEKIITKVKEIWPYVKLIFWVVVYNLQKVIEFSKTLIKGVFNKIKEVLPYIKNILSNVFTIVKTLAGMLKDIIFPIIKTVFGIIKTDGADLFTRVFAIVSDITDQLVIFVNAIKDSKVFKAFLEFLKGLGKSESIFDFISNVFKSIEQNSGLISSILNGILSILEAIFNFDFSKIKFSNLKGLFTGDPKEVVENSKKTKNIYQKMAYVIENITKMLISEIQILIRGALDTLKDILPDVTELIKSVSTSVIEILGHIIAALYSSNIFETIIDFVLDKLGVLLTKILLKIDEFLPKLKTTAFKIIDFIMDIIEYAFSKISEFLMTRVEELKNLVSSILGSDDLGFRGLIKAWFANKFFNMFTDMVSSINTKKILILAAAVGLISYSIWKLSQIDTELARKNADLIIDIVKKLIYAVSLTSVVSTGGAIAGTIAGAKVGGTGEGIKNLFSQFAPIFMIIAIAEAVNILVKALSTLSNIKDIDNMDFLIDRMLIIFNTLEQAIERIMFVFYGFNALIRKLGSANSFYNNVSKDKTLIKIGRNGINPVTDYLRSMAMFLAGIVGAFAAIFIIVKQSSKGPNGAKLLDSTLQIFNSLMVFITALTAAIGGIIAFTLQGAQGVDEGKITAISDLFRLMVFMLDITLGLVAVMLLEIGHYNIDHASLYSIIAIVGITLLAIGLLMKEIFSIVGNTKIDNMKKIGKFVSNIGDVIFSLGFALLMIFGGIALIFKSLPSNLDTNALIAIMGSMAISMLAIFIFLKVIQSIANKSDKKVVSRMMDLAKIIVVLSFAFLLIGKALTNVINTKANPDQVIGVALAMIGIITAFALIIGFMQKLQIKETGSIAKVFISFALSLVLISEALGLLLNYTKNTSWTDLLIVAGVLLAVLLAFAGIIILLTKTKSANTGSEIAKGFITFALSLLVIAIALNAIGRAAEGENFNKALIALGIILGAFVILGLIASVIKANTGLDVGKVFIGLGAGFLVFAAAVLVLSIAIGIFISTFTKFLSLFSDENKESINSMLDNLIEALPKLGEILAWLITTIVAALVATLVNMASEFAKGVVDLITNILVIIAEQAPVIMEALKKIGPLIKFTLEWIIDIIFEVLSNFAIRLMLYIKLIINNLRALLPDVGALIDDLIDLVIFRLDHLLNRILQFIEKNTPTIIDTFLGIIDALIKAFRKHLNTWIDDLIGIICDIIDGIANGISRISNSIRNLLEVIVDEIINLFETAGTLMAKLIKIPAAIFKGLKEGFKREGTSLGDNIMEGIKEGLTDKLKELEKTTTGVAHIVITTLEDVFDIHSPSGETEWQGLMLLKGYAKGLKNKKEQKGIFDTVSDLKATITGAMKTDGTEGDSLIESIKNKLSSMSGKNFDLTAVVTPILDMTKINDQMGDLNSLFGTNNIGVTADAVNSMTDAKAIQDAMNQNGTTNVTNTTVMEQNNYSPKNIDSATSYRQSKNLVDASFHSQGIQQTGTTTGGHAMYGYRQSRRVQVGTNSLGRPIYKYQK